tara:strand:- start:1899 stop:2132 length:234 start_codon:yes stop_codon:yes gene_type:complete
MSTKIIRVYKDYKVEIDDAELKEWKDSIEKHPESGFTIDDFYWGIIGSVLHKEHDDYMEDSRTYRPKKYEIINEENK